MSDSEKGATFIRHDIWPAVLVGWLGILGPHMTIPIYVFFAREEVGLTTGQVGTIGSAFYFAQFLGCFMYGRMADAFGRKPVHIFAMLWSAAIYVMFFFVNGFWSFFLCRLLGGLAGAMNVSKIFVTSTAADRTEVVKEDGKGQRDVETLAAQTGRGLAFAETFAMFVAPLLVAIAVGQLHFARRFIFATACVLCCIAALVCRLCVDESLPPEKRRSLALVIDDSVSSKAEVLARFSKWWAEWSGFAPLLWPTFLMGVVIDAFFIAYPGFLKARFGGGDSLFALILSSFSLIGVLVRGLAYPWLVQKGFEPRMCAMLSCGLTALAGVGIALSPLFAQHLMGCLLLDFGLSLFFVAMPTLCTVMAPEGLLATAQAAAQAALSLGSVFGVFIGGQLADWQMEAPILGASALAVLAGLIFLLALPANEQRSERDLLLGKNPTRV